MMRPHHLASRILAFSGMRECEIGLNDSSDLASHILALPGLRDCAMSVLVGVSKWVH